MQGCVTLPFSLIALDSCIDRHQICPSFESGDFLSLSSHNDFSSASLVSWFALWYRYVITPPKDCKTSNPGYNGRWNFVRVSRSSSSRDLLPSAKQTITATHSNSLCLSCSILKRRDDSNFLQTIFVRFHCSPHLLHKLVFSKVIHKVFTSVLAHRSFPPSTHIFSNPIASMGWL
jgi:hypothetical protein